MKLSQVHGSCIFIEYIIKKCFFFKTDNDTFNKMRRQCSLLFLILKRSRQLISLPGKTSLCHRMLRTVLTDLRAALRQANVFYRRQDDLGLKKVEM